MAGRLRALGAPGVISVLAGAWLACAGPAPPRGVILIVVDTLRADHLGTYGYERETSANLDRWAREGVVFERAFSATSWTLPAFATLFTGQLPSVHGAVGSDDRSLLFGPDPSRATLAQLLSEQGRTTGLIASNAFLVPELASGFATWNVDEEVIWRAPDIARRALAWLERHGGEPFFLLLHFMDPHQPYDAPPPFGGRFSAGLETAVPKPPGDPKATRRRIASMTPEDRAFFIASYDEEIAYLDHHLERLRVELATRGHLDGAVVVLTSDHGEEFFEHGGYEHGHSMYQELLHIPLMMWGPGVRPGRLRQPVSLLDLMPTLLDAAGAPIPDDLPGHSLWPAVTDGAPLSARTLVAEDCLYGEDKTAVIRWPLKAIGKVQTDSWSLFDLEAHPDESRTVSRPAALRELRAELRRQLAAAKGADARGHPVRPSPTASERLRSLGYVE